MARAKVPHEALPRWEGHIEALVHGQAFLWVYLEEIETLHYTLDKSVKAISGIRRKFMK